MPTNLPFVQDVLSLYDKELPKIRTYFIQTHLGTAHLPVSEFDNDPVRLEEALDILLRELRLLQKCACQDEMIIPGYSYMDVAKKNLIDRIKYFLTIIFYSASDDPDLEDNASFEDVIEALNRLKDQIESSAQKRQFHDCLRTMQIALNILCDLQKRLPQTT